MTRRSDHANHRTAGTWALALGLLLAAHTVPAAGASGLDDLRAALEGLRGTVPVKVTLTAQVTTVSKDDDDKVRNASGTATLAAEDGPQGLRLAYPRDIAAQ
jgi:hypothetical protein